jgi:hypothetical protein
MLPVVSLIVALSASFSRRSTSTGVSLLLLCWVAAARSDRRGAARAGRGAAGEGVTWARGGFRRDRQRKRGQGSAAQWGHQEQVLPSKPL